MDATLFNYDISQIASRLTATLIHLLVYSAFIWGGLSIVFGTRMFNKYLGDGTKDGQPSVYLPDANPKPWIAMLVGFGVAFFLDLNFFFYYEGVSNQQYIDALAQMHEQGLALGYVPAWLGVVFLNLITGLVVGSGPKAFIAIAEVFVAAKDRIVAVMKAKTEKTE